MYSGLIECEIALSLHLITFISGADEGSYLFKTSALASVAAASFSRQTGTEINGLLRTHCSHFFAVPHTSQLIRLLQTHEDILFLHIFIRLFG